MKSWSKIALIPAYNPEYCLVDLVQTLKKKGSGNTRRISGKI